MFQFVDDPRCFLGGQHCDYDEAAAPFLLAHRPLIVCGLPNEVRDVQEEAIRVGRPVSSIDRTFDAEAFRTLGHAPVLTAPVGVSPFLAISLLDRNLHDLPPMEWLDAAVVTMWRPRGKTGIYQFDLISMSEARAATAFDVAFFEACRFFWDPNAEPPHLDDWLDKLGGALSKKPRTRPSHRDQAD